MEIRPINFGIASRKNKTIYVNKKLQVYPELYHAILEHEKEHTSGFSWKDITIDLRHKHLKGLRKQYYQFILKNPSTLIEFLPLWIYDGHLTINPLILLLYGAVLTILGILGGYMA